MMRRTSKPKATAPVKEIKTENVAAQLPMDERPLRFAIAGGVILLFGIFYWTRKLFEAYNYNDFGEYFLRAQDWINGEFVNRGGSDILLSVVEYLGLLIHPHDFLASYYLSIRILIVLLLSASFLFIVRRNALLPGFWTKLTAMVLALSIPHFIYATVTLDQSLLFGACLLFFLSTYNIRWVGAVVAAATFFSRPEALLILPLFAVLFFLDKKKRIDIVINAVACIAIVLAVKFFLNANIESTKVLTRHEEYRYLEQIDWNFFWGILKRIPKFPFVIAMYGYECLQNTFLWLFFLVGFVFSIRSRKAWPFYAILFFFLLAYAVQSAHSHSKPLSDLTSVISQMMEEEDYFMVKARHKFDPIISHGRYRLVLYPAIAIFVILGFLTTLKLPFRYLLNKPLPRAVPVALLVFIGAVALYNAVVRFRPIGQEYKAERKLARMHPVYKMGLELRKMEATGAVLIDGFCDETDGGFFMSFSSYSGLDTLHSRFCKFGIWVQDENKKRLLVNHKDYQDEMPYNPYLVAKFYRSTALRSELYDSTTVKRWELLASTFNDSLMKEENVDFVLSPRVLPLAHLEVVDSVAGGGYIHKRKED